MRTVDGEGNDGYEGFIKDLVEEITSTQGFTYELQLSVDNKYGVENGGNWSGLVGMLHRGVRRTDMFTLVIDWKYYNYRKLT